jgi:hypothetical protein
MMVCQYHRMSIINNQDQVTTLFYPTISISAITSNRQQREKGHCSCSVKVVSEELTYSPPPYKNIRVHTA